jgi:hypothetical protein
MFADVDDQHVGPAAVEDATVADTERRIVRRRCGPDPLEVGGFERGMPNR